MQEIIHDEIRQAVRERYGRVAESSVTGCGCGTSCCDGEREPEPRKAEESVASGCGCTTSCCSGESSTTAEEASLALGYSQEEVASVPEGANIGLGCGNPQAIASLKAGETVLDLGSGEGIDSFLAARQVGSSGQVIGVDVIPEMITKARKNAVRARANNVEFRLGEIERLPVATGSIDVIISNCVINLSPSKESVFKEAFRVLKGGRRLAIADIVARTHLPEEARRDLILSPDVWQAPH